MVLHLEFLEKSDCHRKCEGTYLEKPLEAKKLKQGQQVLERPFRNEVRVMRSEQSRKDLR